MMPARPGIASRSDTADSVSSNRMRPDSNCCECERSNGGSACYHSAVLAIGGPASATRSVVTTARAEPNRIFQPSNGDVSHAEPVPQDPGLFTTRN